MASQPDLKDLRRHYAGLSDEGLLAMDRASLTETAQQCFDDEVAKRGLELADGEDAASHGGGEPEPDWIEDAASACSFDSYPGNDATPDVEEAETIFEAAEIPCYVKITELEGGNLPQPAYRYDLLVPGGLILQATSALDKDLFNPRQEAEWKAHFGELSDDDFHALDIEDLTAGLLDRVERLKRVYAEEQERRGS